ncbi:hypothetical protein BH20CHL4_BH20CHL4_16000 [soil metagenome]
MQQNLDCGRGVSLTFATETFALNLTVVWSTSYQSRWSLHNELVHQSPAASRTILLTALSRSEANRPRSF